MSLDQSPPTPLNSARRSGGGVLTSLSVAAAIFSALVAWSGRSANTDLFMALAGGRDVAAGKIGKPDDWSYITQGRVWINQSWLTGWALYRVHEATGPSGLMAAHIVLLALLLVGMMLWVRGQGRSWPATLLTCAIAATVLRPHLILRGNLVSIAVFPWFLLIIDRQRRGPVAWTAALSLLLILWMQCHGGFVLGFALCVVYSVILLAVWIKAPTQRQRSIVYFAAGFVLAAVVGTLISPFGLETWRQSAGMAMHSEWRTIREWQPLLNIRGFWPDIWNNFSTTGTYLVFLACVIVLRNRVTKERVMVHSDPASVAFLPYRLLFSALTAWLLVLLALYGRRFIPFSVISLALPLATVFDTLLLTTRPRAWLSAAAVCVGAAFLVYPTVFLGYSGRNPFYPAGESLFDRQVEQVQNPVAAAAFMRENGIVGPVLHTYDLESYLAWAVPGVKVGCGGRAQQIYTEEDLVERRAMDDPRALRQIDFVRRREICDKHRIGAILFPMSTRAALIFSLIERGEWVPAFFDGEFCILVRADGPFRSFAEDAVANARIPDESTRLRTTALRAAMSRRFGRCRNHVEAAQRVAPNSALYFVLDAAARASDTAASELRDFYEGELKRLESLPHAGANAAMVLDCRAAAARRLAHACKSLGDAAGERRAIAAAESAERTLDRLARLWQM